MPSEPHDMRIANIVVWIGVDGQLSERKLSPNLPSFVEASLPFRLLMAPFRHGCSNRREGQEKKITTLLTSSRIYTTNRTKAKESS